jgi:uncharacterized membrane-anchored protein YhcB (DUF1043 family)
MDQIVVDPVLLGALTALVAIAAAGLGLLLGRRQPRARDLARIAELEAELAAARSSAESTKGGIDEHFEASAALFGKLAQDYRALFEHWADSATRLGVSEDRAAAIIDQARARLLENARTVDAETGADAETTATDEAAEGGSADSGIEASEGGTTERVDADAAGSVEADDTARARRTP